MIHYLSILFFVVIVGMTSLFLVADDNIVTESVSPNTIHFFNDQDKKIENINLKIYYFVPKDKSAYNYSDLTLLLSSVAENLMFFHKSTFSSLSRIDYSIYKEPVFGFSNSDFYNGDNTNNGNPNALEAILKEIEMRGQAGGDLADFGRLNDSDFNVVYIIYEGIGASGASNVALLNRRYLTDPEYNENNSAYFAHEFYHTIGVPDGYDLSTGTSTSADLMGLLKDTDLKKNFLDNEITKNMGI